MEKVASMQALLADNFCENCGHFCINNEFLAVFPINCHKSTFLIHNQSIFRKNIQCIRKNFNFGQFYMIRKVVILRTFFNPENSLADKNQLFPCLITRSTSLALL